MRRLDPDGVALLRDWSVVEARGPDAIAFIQGFCTNDVEKLGEGQSCEAFFTDVKARVLAYGWVGRLTDRVLVVISSTGAERLAEHLDRYLIREQVELVVGGAVALVGREIDPMDTAVAAVGASAFGCGAMLKVGEPSAIDSALSHALSEGRRRVSDEEFQELRIGLGIPLDRIDVDENNLPQEVDRNDRAISFTKGCYLGQEPVARIDALGRVNRLLRGLRVEGADTVLVGEEVLHDGAAIGRVTSCVSLESESLCLGYARREHSAPGERLTVAGREAVVSALPFEP